MSYWSNFARMRFLKADTGCAPDWGLGEWPADQILARRPKGSSGSQVRGLVVEGLDLAPGGRDLFDHDRRVGPRRGRQVAVGGAVAAPVVVQPGRRPQV